MFKAYVVLVSQDGKQFAASMEIDTDVLVTARRSLVVWLDDETNELREQKQSRVIVTDGTKGTVQ